MDRSEDLCNVFASSSIGFCSRVFGFSGEVVVCQRGYVFGVIPVIVGGEHVCVLQFSARREI